MVGITNPPDKGTTGGAVSGTLWVNELRVLDADGTPGWAYSLNGSVNLADLMNINANISQTNPYFHKLADQFGSRMNQLNWGIAVDLDLLKLIPLNLSGSNFRVSYSRTEQSSNPLYIPGTDIKIEDAQRLTSIAMADSGLTQEAINDKVNGYLVY